MKYNGILMFGAPGSGKGTQGKAIGCLPGFVHTSTGDLFRALDKNSELGKIVGSYSSKGELVPDEITIRLWTETMKAWALAGKINAATDLLIMDGVPRNAKQAQLLDPAVDVQKIILLDVSNMDAMIARLRGRAIKEGRKDNADEKVIRNRMEIYDRETRPVLAHYPADKVAHRCAAISRRSARPDRAGPCPHQGEDREVPLTGSLASRSTPSKPCKMERRSLAFPSSLA